MCNDFYHNEKPEKAYHLMIKKDYPSSDEMLYFYVDPSDDQPQELPMPPSSQQDENPSEPSKKPRAIIPDYLLKQIQEYHEQEEADEETLEKDRQNREKSDQLRKERQENTHETEH